MLNTLLLDFDFGFIDIDFLNARDNLGRTALAHAYIRLNEYQEGENGREEIMQQVMINALEERGATM